MFTSFVSLLAVVPLLAADSPAGARKGPAELQATWRLVSVEAETGSVSLPDPRPVFVIKDDRLLYGGEEIASIAADSATKPKILDLRIRDAKRFYEGVYTVEKDSMKLCLNSRADGVKERPDSFSVKDHPAWRLLTFERVKAVDAGVGNGFIGLILGYDNNRQEVIVGGTLDGSPAKKAGLSKDDVLLEVNGMAPTDLRSTVEAVRQAKPRSELALRIRRGGKEREVKLKVGLLPFAILAGLD